MQIRRIQRVRRKAGISEIIATLLIVLTTIAIGIVLVTTSTTTLANNVLNDQFQVSIATQRIQERIRPYDAWFHEAGNGTRLASIQILNYGPVDLVVATIYTNVTGAISPLSNFTSSHENGVYISSGDQASITVAFGYAQGSTYTFSFTTQSGNTFDATWSA